tara:strand:+ start:12383 stop:12667 length:285 start_codon:yes stop_codon:yes gene_type:complete
MGKGSKQRPTDRESFDNNYDAIFGNKGKRKMGELVHWCKFCEAGKPEEKVVWTVIPETYTRRASEQLSCEDCGHGDIVKYEFQDLSEGERLYLD